VKEHGINQVFACSVLCLDDGVLCLDDEAFLGLKKYILWSSLGHLWTIPCLFDWVVYLALQSRGKLSMTRN